MTENVPMHYIGVRDGKRKMEKEGKNNHRHLNFPMHNTLL